SRMRALCVGVQTTQRPRVNFQASAAQRDPDASLCWATLIQETVMGERGMSRANGTREWYRPHSGAIALGAGLLSALLAACSGTTGSAGPAGATGTTRPARPTLTRSGLNNKAGTPIPR